MSDKGSLKRLADFEWAAAMRYIVHVSNVAGLAQINSNSVVSFALGRLGPDKLLRQKQNVLILLEGNKKSIERFVGAHKSKIGVNELAVLRSLYLQYKNDIEMVRGHIGFVEKCMAESELSLLKTKKEEENDFPF